MQHNKYAYHQYVKMYCATNQFPKIKFLGPYKKPHGVCGLDKHYHTCFDPKPGHDTYEIRRIPCDFTLSTYILDQPFIPGFPVYKNLDTNLSKITHTGLC